MDVSYSSDEENLNVESSDDLDSEVESFTVLLSMETSQNIRSRQFLNKLILSVVVWKLVNKYMHTIIFVLSYVFFIYSGERHLNFILTDLKNSIVGCLRKNL